MRRRGRRLHRRRDPGRRRRLRHRRPAPPPPRRRSSAAWLLVDAGHWATEWPWLGGPREDRRARSRPRGHTVSTRRCRPWSPTLGRRTAARVRGTPRCGTHPPRCSSACSTCRTSTAPSTGSRTAGARCPSWPRSSGSRRGSPSCATTVVGARPSSPTSSASSARSRTTSTWSAARIDARPAAARHRRGQLGEGAGEPAARARLARASGSRDLEDLVLERWRRARSIETAARRAERRAGPPCRQRSRADGGDAATRRSRRSTARPPTHAAVACASGRGAGRSAARPLREGAHVHRRCGRGARCTAAAARAATCRCRRSTCRRSRPRRPTR